MLCAMSVERDCARYYLDKNIHVISSLSHSLMVVTGAT